MINRLNQLASKQISKLKWINSGLLRSKVVRNIAVLFTSTTYAQLLPFALAPVIARLYNPLDYALLAAFSSITLITCTIVTGMYDVAIMLDKDDEDAYNTSLAALVVTIFMTCFSTSVVYIFSHFLAIIIKNENLITYFYLIPVLTFFTGLYRILNVWTNRKQRYKRMSVNRVIQSSLNVSMLLLFGFYRFGGKGLLFSSVIGQVFTSLLLLIQTVSDDRKVIRKVSLSKIKSSIKRYKDFPQYNLPQALMDGIRESSILIIIANFYGQTILGSYSFAYNILMKPLRFIGESVGQVYFQHASNEFKKKGTIKGIFKKTLFSVSIIGLPFFAILALVGGQVFSLVFSSKWAQAGLYTQIMAFWLYARFIVSPVSTTPIIFEKQKVFFFISILVNVIPPFVLYLSSYLGFKVEPALTAFVAVNSLMYMIMLLWFFRIVLEKHYAK